MLVFVIANTLKLLTYKPYLLPISCREYCAVHCAIETDLFHRLSLICTYDLLCRASMGCFFKQLDISWWILDLGRTALDVKKEPTIEDKYQEILSVWWSIAFFQSPLTHRIWHSSSCWSWYVGMSNIRNERSGNDADGRDSRILLFSENQLFLVTAVKACTSC